MAYVPNSGSVVAFQSDPTKLVGTVSVVGVSTPHSVSGVGLFNVNHVGNGSIIAVSQGSIGAVIIGGSVAVSITPPANQSVSGTVNLGPTSVTALQGTNPWFVQLTSGSIITSGGTTGNSSVTVMGTVPASVSGVGVFNTNNIGSGSIFTVIQSGNSSVTGTMSVLGTVPVTQATNPWMVQLTSGSIITSGGTTGNSSVAVVSTVPASVSGVGIFNVNHIGNGSILTVSLGSIATAPSPASVSGVGLFNVNHTGNGSIITVFSSPSIVGTYAEDSAHTTTDKGVFALQVRNDTMSSITSSDGDYSPQAVGPIGEVLTANAPITKWLSAQTSVMYGVSVQAVAPQGASVFTYITGIQVANNSATNALVKFTGGLGSVLGWTIAPANGGSNVVFPNGLKTGENSGVSASINALSSVYVTMVGFISKA